MKFVDEYRDGKLGRSVAHAIAREITQTWTIMEICGGQTHAIMKFGIDQMLPPAVNLVHGPGCPVCVTPLQKIDNAIAIAANPDVILCTFGDMLRVPGSQKDLLSAKAQGADVRMVYSPLDALNIADRNPDKQVVFFAVGFETTAPTTAAAVMRAKHTRLRNFSLIVSHVLVPPAMKTILSSQDNRVQGFLAAGHVCTVMGYSQYLNIARYYHVPIVVTGFEPVDILRGIYFCISQLENGQAKVDNQYRRAVSHPGNQAAQKLMQEVFTVVEQQWRGLGTIADSGLALKPVFSEFDAERRFDFCVEHVEEPAVCQSGLVLQGLIKPIDCPVFATKCTPDHPLGATMVSSEGACAAYYKYRSEDACV